MAILVLALCQLRLFLLNKTGHEFSAEIGSKPCKYIACENWIAFM